MSACREYQELLTGMLDGTLTAAQRDRLWAHLDQCPGCAQALEEQRRTLDRIRALPQVEPPPWLAERILARAREQAPSRWRRLSRWLCLAPVPAAAILVLCLTGYAVLRSPGSRTTQAIQAEPQPRQEVPVPEAPAPPTVGSSRPSGPAGWAPAPAPKAPAPAPATSAPTLAAPAPAAPPAAEEAAPRPPATSFAPAPGTAAQAPEAGASSLDAAAPRSAGAVHTEVQVRKRALAAGEAAQEKAVPTPPALVLRLEPRDPSRTAAQVEAAFQEAGAEFLARPAPGSPLLAARVPAAALPSLVKRLQALGGLRTLQPLPEGGRAPDVLVTLGW